MSTATHSRVSELSDAALVDATRAGDNDAFGELWARHSGAARRAARAITNSIDPDDLVSEAFTKTFSAIRNGAGPTDGFRPYLYAAVRSAAATWGGKQQDLPIDYLEDLPDQRPDSVDQLSDKTMLISAFRALPENHRTLLWYLEVDGMKPREIAPIMGLTSNGVSALAIRARDGFRHAWLDAHIADPNRPEDCRWVCEKLVRRKRRPVTRHERPRFDQHLSGCKGCEMVAREIDHVSSKLRAVMLPLVLGSGGAAAYSSLEAGTAVNAAPMVAGARTTSVAAGLMLAGGLSLILGSLLALGAPWESSTPEPVTAPVDSWPRPGPDPPAAPDPDPAPVEPHLPPTVEPGPGPEPPSESPPLAVPPLTEPAPPLPPVKTPPVEPVPASPFDVGVVDTTDPTSLMLAGTGAPGGVIALMDELDVVLTEAIVDAAGAFATMITGDQLRQGMVLTARHTAPDGVVELSDRIGPLTFPLPAITSDGPILQLTHVDADGDGDVDDAFATFDGIAGSTIRVAVDDVVRAHLVILDDIADDDYFADIPLGSHVVTLRYVDPGPGTSGPGADFDVVVVPDPPLVNGF